MAAPNPPYWGNLEPPPVNRQNSTRRSSVDEQGSARYSSQYSPQQQQQQQRRSTRTSTQSQATTIATDSSYVSPSRSSFSADGLAPRPPSFAYGTPEVYNKDYLDKRRRRASRETEQYYRGNESVVPPPAAPDAPKPPPPLSYKQPYSNSRPPASSQAPVRSRSTRRSEGPQDIPQIKPADTYRDGRNEVITSRPEQDLGSLANTEYRRERKSIGGDSDRPRDYQDKSVVRRGTVGARRERPEYHEPVAPTQPRKSSVAEAEAQRRREWAPDRSPLQRLELTLDSITKEEKRARVEEAELLARESKAGRGGDRANQNSVRFRNRPVAKTIAEPAPQVEPQSLPEAGLVRNLSTKQRDELQRSGTIERKRPVDTEPTTTRQLGKGFEYQPQPEPVSTTREPENPSALQRGQSGRERAVAASTGAAVVAAGLSRSGSNKLKKEPPGDPWFSRRKELEERYPEITPRRPSEEARGGPNGMTGGPLGSAPVALSSRKLHPDIHTRQTPPNYDGEDHINPAKIPISSSKRVEQLMGPSATAGSSKTISPQQQKSYADRVIRSEGLGQENGRRNGNSGTKIRTVNGINNAASPQVAGANGQERMHPGSPDGNLLVPGHDLLSHHRRSQYLPGEGLYVSDRPLEEWKEASVAVLTRALLDLEVKQTESEKDKAWWETGHTGRRRPSSSRQRNVVETYDGEYDSNGMVFPNFSHSLEENDVRFISTVGVRTWSKIEDPVLPITREFTHHQEAPPTEIDMSEQCKWWSLKKPAWVRPQRVAQPSSTKRHLLTAVFSPFLPNCPHISKHNIFHPFHCCPQNFKPLRKKLTPTMRLIRVSITAPTQFKPQLYLQCGPLLRYCGLRRETAASRPGHSSTTPAREIWRGTVMIVTTDSASSYEVPPTLRLFAQPMDLLPPPPAQVDGGAEELAPEYVDPIAGLPKIGRDGKTLYVRPVEQLEEEKDLSKIESDNGLFESQRSLPDGNGLGHDSTVDAQNSPAGRSQKRKIDGERLGKHVEVKGFRLHVERGVTFWRFNIEVELGKQQQRVAYRINLGPATGFWVPAKGQSMNIMFHTCNGFSQSVNPDQFSGPDPMWRDVLNTHQTQPFHVMIGGGDQVYNDSLMKNAKQFSHWLSIKNPLEKHNAPFTPQMQMELETFYLERYSTWFSQGLFGLANSQIPMVNIYDDHDIIDGFGSYPPSFMDTPVFSGLGAIAFKYYMLFQHQSIIDEGEEAEPSWLLGTHPGPYIKELSRSVFMKLGSNIAFLGLDCRTERMQDTVLTEETMEKVIDRMHDVIVKGETNHLIVLLGVPIAYPRLVWLENILTSRLMDPIKAVGKSPIFGNFIGQLDGGVEVLDDLNDHWTAKNHKQERKELIEDLQDLAASKSIRVTILSGDVHLAAIGQFYSNPKLGVRKDQDFRYMPNVISSAIVNTPPPNAMADILNRRNKVHHLGDETDENMIPLFEQDVNGINRNNKRLMPRRNWCSIREYNPELTPPQTPIDERSPSPPPRGGLLRRLSSSRGPSYRPDVGPPPSRGMMRNFSLRGRSSTDSERPSIRQRALSLSSRDFRPANLFRRVSRSRHDDGGINGYGSEDDNIDLPAEQLHPPRIRGGAGDESYFPHDDAAPFTRTRVGRHAVIRDNDNEYSSYDEGPRHQHQVHQQQAATQEPTRRPFHRTPTGMSEKQRQKLGPNHEVNLEGGLDICLNVEVNQKDPAGITVPYRLLVPRLWYEDNEPDELVPQKNPKKATGLTRFMSFGRRKSEQIPPFEPASPAQGKAKVEQIPQSQPRPTQWKGKERAEDGDNEEDNMRRAELLQTL